jgi:hypothetical protein
VKAKQATLRPLGGELALENAAAEFRVTPALLTIENAGGDIVGGGSATATGTLTLGDEPRLALDVTASEVAFSPELRDDLPENARAAWDWLAIEGAADVALNYDGGLAFIEGELPRGAAFEATIEPRGARVRPSGVPYEVGELSGKIRVTPERVFLEDVVGRHANGARVTVSGNGKPITTDQRGPATLWSLAATLTDAPVDDDLRTALPAAVRELVTQLELGGVVSLELPTLDVLLLADGSPPDVNFDARLRGEALGLSVGVPVTEATAALSVAGSVRNEVVTTLGGDISAKTLQMAGRPVADVAATFKREAGVLEFNELQATFAGGGLSGSAELTLPEAGPRAYALDLTLREADARLLVPTPPGGEPVTAAVTATLFAEGRVGEASSRRGRGDVRIEGVGGGTMVRLPLVMGVLQVVSLALPKEGGFTSATASYALDDQTLLIENVDISGGDIALRGGGRLDFATGNVNLNLQAENPGLKNVPIFGDLLAAARNEMVNIRVRGTIDNPEVSNTPLATFTTTVDEVLRGE